VRRLADKNVRAPALLEICSQLANNFDYCSAENDQLRFLEVPSPCLTAILVGGVRRARNLRTRWLRRGA
jgi:hypothetical protein